MQPKWITPAVTAMDHTGNIDLAGNSALYQYLISGKTDGILILGSIGEFFAIPLEQKKKLICHAVKAISHTVPLYVGTGGMSAEECVELSNFAFQQGAEAVIVISPYYFQLPEPSQIAFYEKIASCITGPMLLYNFPDRTGYSLMPETVLTLALNHSNIIGIKDTTNDMSHTRALIQTVKKARPDFAVYSGFDEYFMHNLLCGGDGCIAGIANFAPSLLSNFVQAASSKDFDLVSKFQKKVDYLMKIYQISPQFIPIIKEAVKQCGIPINSKCSHPILEASPQQKEEVQLLLKNSGILP